MPEHKNAEIVAAAVAEQRAVSVLRGDDPARMLEVAEAVIAGGMRLIEVTMTIPGAPDLLGKLAAGHGEDALLGAGSVTTMGETVEMISHGAKFIVCPHTDQRIIEYCRDNGIYVAAGGLSPTEVMEAYLTGVDLVKVYPVKAVGGPEYIRSLLRPMPFLRLMPVGGLNPGDVADYIRAGAVAVGASSLPLHGEQPERISLKEVSKRSRAFLDAVRSATN